jgi:hypothetical protein
VKLVTFARGDDGPRLGAAVAERVLDLRAAEEALEGSASQWSRSLLDLLEGGDEARRAAEALVARVDDAGEALLDRDAVTLLAPLPRPSSIRDCMSFERHVLQATRKVGLGPRRSIAGLLDPSA